MAKAGTNANTTAKAAITGNRDAKAPGTITANIIDSDGKNWGPITLTPKDFTTGSVGYYGQGKLVNPGNPGARYQCGLTFTLIGSKPQA